jgi:hypothetical protein
MIPLSCRSNLAGLYLEVLDSLDCIITGEPVFLNVYGAHPVSTWHCGNHKKPANTTFRNFINQYFSHKIFFFFLFYSLSFQHDPSIFFSWIQRFKGTVLRDRFRKCWRKLTDLGLNKGHGWFLNFLEVPLIFSLNKKSSIR